MTDALPSDTGHDTPEPSLSEDRTSLTTKESGLRGTENVRSEPKDVPAGHLSNDYAGRPSGAEKPLSHILPANREETEVWDFCYLHPYVLPVYNSSGTGT